MKPVEILKWKGLVNTTAPERLKPGQLSTALDVNIDGGGVLVTRRGMTLVSAAASHSMFATDSLCLVMQGAVMKRMDESGALTTLATLASSRPVSWAELDGRVYFTNGSDTGRVVGGAVREWGIRRPLGQPAAAASSTGSLPPGRYLYAATFVRDDGMESGTLEPGLVELTAAGGIDFSSVPQSTDDSVAGTAVYLSAPNGTELYRAFVVPAGTASYSYGNGGLDLGSPLPPDPAFPAPAGSAVATHVGCLYVAVGDAVYVSDLYAPDRFRLSKRFLRLPGPVTMVRPVSAGVYVGTDAETWFFAGTDFDDLRPRKVLVEGAVPGTDVALDSGERASPDEGDKPSRPAAMWMSTDGIIYGDPDGNVTKVTMDDYGIPPAQTGSAMLMSRDGVVAYVTTLRGSAATGNAHP